MSIVYGLATRPMPPCPSHCFPSPHRFTAPQSAFRNPQSRSRLHALVVPPKVRDVDPCSVSGLQSCIPALGFSKDSTQAAQCVMIRFMKSITGIRLLALLFLASCLSGCASMREDPPGYDVCLKNSSTVWQAKRTYALGHNVPEGTEVSWSDLATCLPANWRPVCPQGGKLTPGPIGQWMKCSFHGQLPVQ